MRIVDVKGNVTVGGVAIKGGTQPFENRIADQLIALGVATYVAEAPDEVPPASTSLQPISNIKKVLGEDNEYSGRKPTRRKRR